MQSFILFWVVALICGMLLPAEADGVGGLVTTILSQANPFHRQRAREKQQLWTTELDTWNITDSMILLSHELTDHRGVWTIIPLLPILFTDYENAGWFLFVTEETNIDFRQLKNVLKSHDPTKELFLGHALHDQQRTIIHHYISADGQEVVLYPNLPSGWILSYPALHKLVNHLSSFDQDFNIDPQFEMAVFARYLFTPDLMEFFPEPPPPSQGGILLTHVDVFCMAPQRGGEGTSCATHYSQDLPHCDAVVALSEVFFAVKTCEKFHSKRLPVLQQTWGRDAEENIVYYSEVADPVYSTTDIGVPNTKSGHCGKTFAIINKFCSDPELSNKKWLIIADDDTLLSVPRLCQLLACFDPHQSILLGEAYGYKAHHPQGNTYITGGGGMVLSRVAAQAIVEAGHKCPSPDYPDDMYLGTVARQLDIDVIHSPLFHQSQPDSFHPSILHLQTPVSFHRHTPRDPYAVYREFLAEGGGDEGTSSGKTKEPWKIRSEL